jgi:glycosyltransferase involved in cell wall biosynthesis
MLDIRWFAPNRYCSLPVPRLQEAGLRIATHGDASARLVIAADGACAVEAYRFAWRHRCPMVVYLWDLPPWQLDGGRPNVVLPFRGRVVKVPRPWGGYPGRTGYFSRLRYIARNALEVWAPSRNTQDDIGRRFGVEAQHVPFCFDTDRFNRAAGWRKPTAGRPVVLSISRLERHKNQAAVIRAVASLSAQPLVRIVGKGPEAAHLQSLATQLGIDLQLDEGWLTDEQIVEAYRTASVLVCPSRFEGLGVTPLQGVAIGMPTVASDIPTHREFVVGQAALVPLDDDAAMAAAIDAALRSEGTVQPGPAHPVPELTIEACAARFLPRLEELLRGAG